MSTTSGVTLTPVSVSKVEPVDQIVVRFDQSFDSALAATLAKMFGNARFPGVVACPINAVRDGGRALLAAVEGDAELLLEEKNCLFLGGGGTRWDEHAFVVFELGKWKVRDRKLDCCSASLLMDDVFADRKAPVGLAKLLRYGIFDDATASFGMELSLGAILRTVRNISYLGDPWEQIRFVETAVRAYLWAADRYSADRKLDRKLRSPSKPEVAWLLQKLESWETEQATLCAKAGRAPFDPKALEKLKAQIAKGPSKKAREEKFSAFELVCLAKTVEEYCAEMGDDILDWLHPIFLAVYKKYVARSEASALIKQKDGPVRLQGVKYGGKPITLAVYKGDNPEVKGRLGHKDKRGRTKADVMIQWDTRGGNQGKGGSFRISRLTEVVSLGHIAEKLGKAEHIRRGGERDHKIPDWVWRHEGTQPGKASTLYNFSPDGAGGEIISIMHASLAVPDVGESSFKSLDDIVEFVIEALAECTPPKKGPRRKQKN
jgi:hypothetical protein